MKTRTRTALMAVAFAATAAALVSQAADQGNWFEQQRMISDGYYPQYTVAPRVTKPESPRTAAENAWLEKERIADSYGSKPVPFTPPPATVASDSEHAEHHADASTLTR